jgi:hypothetical protein
VAAEERSTVGLFGVGEFAVLVSVDEQATAVTTAVTNTATPTTRQRAPRFILERSPGLHL